MYVYHAKIKLNCQSFFVSIIHIYAVIIAYDGSFIANTDVSVGLYLNSFQPYKG